METDTQTHTHTHTDTQTKYSNPRCACAPRVKKATSKHQPISWKWSHPYIKHRYCSREWNSDPISTSLSDGVQQIAKVLQQAANHKIIRFMQVDYTVVSQNTSMGNELKWLLRERVWAYFRKSSLSKIGPPHLKAGPPCLKVGLPSTQKVQT